MDNSSDFVGSVEQAGPQTQIPFSASKQNFSSKQILDDSNNPADDTICNLTNTTCSQRPNSSEEQAMHVISQLPFQVNKLSLKCGASHGVMNGLGENHSVDSSYTSDYKIFSQSHSIPLCSDKCKKGYETIISDTNSVCNNNHFDNFSRSIKTLNFKDRAELNADTSPHEDVTYVSYKSELQISDIMKLIQKDLSEPYSIYTYRYFIHNWPKLCFLAMNGGMCIGAIVCKLDVHREIVKRGYIAMLAVDERFRKRGIGSNLVLKAIRAMVEEEADEVVLETEITNLAALRLYENLGFVRDKRLFRYYLNGVDALRLKLWLK